MPSINLPLLSLSGRLRDFSMLAFRSFLESDLEQQVLENYFSLHCFFSMSNNIVSGIAVWFNTLMNSLKIMFHVLKLLLFVLKPY